MSENNGYATRESFLSGRQARRYADVNIDGQKFRLRSLNALEANTIQARVIVEDDEEDRIREIATANCRTISQCVVDGNGDRIFTDEDVDQIAQVDAGFVSRLAEACSLHANHRPDAVETAEKNS